MNNCHYCGEVNPSTVFNCLKCSAMMPVQPVPVAIPSVIQQRKEKITVRQIEPPAQKTVQSMGRHYQVTETSFKDLCIYMCCGFLVVALIGGFMYFASAMKPDPPTYKATSESVSANTGFYLDYKFTIMKKDTETKIVALFQPKMIPRNDEIFIGATRKVIEQAYNETTSKEPFPVGKAIFFPCSSGAYAVIPIKEDTGEVHSLVIEKVDKQ